MKSTYIKYIVIILLVTTSIYSCIHKPDKNISIYAAAGTMQAVTEINNQFYKATTQNNELNFAASGALARQIFAGAEADIYISANKQWIDYLSEKELLIKESITEFATNKLVVITNVSNNLAIDFSKEFDIASVINDKISIGDPQYVPVGKYAKQAFDTLNWYHKIQNRVILAKDVSSVLNYVALNECDWGIVYYSEAIKSDKVKIVSVIPEHLHSPITFYIATLNNKKNTKRVFNYFLNKESLEIFNKFGFITNKN